MSCKDVAHQFNKSKSKTVTAATVKAWESGDAHPSYSQLEMLAYKIYRRPVAVFFFPEPPEEESITQKFRSLPEAQAKLLPPKIRYLARKAEVFLMNLRELFGGQNPAPRRIFRDFNLSLKSDMQKEGERVRDYLTPPKSAKADEMLKEWRRKLEDVGVFVFKDNFQNDQFSGFCLHDKLFPVIYLNNNMPETRQAFTLFHELAHILMRQNGVNFRGAIMQDPMEVACNRFAGAALVPENNFNSRLARIDDCTTDAAIEKLARPYGISREVILRKLLDRHLITTEEYDEKAKKYFNQLRKSRKESVSSGGSYYATQLAYVGTRYAEAALGKYYGNQIDAYQLADYVGVKPGNISAFEKYILKGAAS